MKVDGNQELIKEAADLFFKLGYKPFPNTGVEFWIDQKAKYLVIGFFETFIDWNSGVEGYEVTLPELRSMVTPNQKEYLVKTDTGYTLQVLSNVVDGHNGIIEVPEGSNIAWKDNSNGFVFFTKMEMGYRDATIIWKRESLNDQVASAEQARQEQTQTREISECDLIDSGKLIIGGLGESFPAGLEHHKFIQPEGFSEGGFIPKQNHGAPVGLLHHGFSGFTQPEELPFVGDTQQTLNERQSQYGDFKDVAEMTQGLLFVMEQYGYKDMPDMHKEALHMICSKMARIVNGDHNHLDSWHDIGGYAKLIENNIK